MDLLKKIQCQPYNLEILVEELESYYLEVELRSGYHYFKYILWNNFASFKEIIEKFVLLYDIPDGELFIDGNFTSIVQEIDEDNKIVWLLIRVDEDFQIFIWQNPIEFEYLESIYFDSNLYFELFEEEPLITSGLIMQMNGKPSDFAKTLLKFLDKLKFQVEERSLENEFDLSLPHHDYNILVSFANKPSGNSG